MAFFDSEISADSTTTARLDTGATVSSRIDTALDQDWFRVRLEEGTIYQFDLEGTGGTDGLWDPYLLVHDGTAERASDDDGGHGLAARITYTATHSGDHFVAATAFGSHTGDYWLSARALETPSLTDSIDWNAPLPSTDVTVYFAAADVTIGGHRSVGWDAYQIAQAMAALQEYADVSGLTFRQISDPDAATFRLVAADSGFFGGIMYPQDQGANAGLGVFNTDIYDFSRAGGQLEPGGTAYDLLLHEFGHGLGLAHPHDSGGGSAVLRDVDNFLGDTGAFGLNQAVYTVMSYNNGFQGDGVLTPPGGFGNNAALGALDIAVVQSHYGVNTETKASASVYTLPDMNAAGTGYGAIWDAGGNDWISHDGTAGATIDLRAATLEYEEGGGGFISRVDGILGGVTIAHGVVIENARGGGGDDLLTGNAAANRLVGRGGDDTLRGDAGDDVLLGGAGVDRLHGGAGDDYLSAGTGAAGRPERLFGEAGDDIYALSSRSDFVVIGAAAERADGGHDTVRFSDLSTRDISVGTSDFGTGEALDLSWARGAGTGTLRIADLGAQIERFEFTDQGFDAILTAPANAETNAKATALVHTVGTAADEILIGGAGRDVLRGGGGDDLLDAGGMDTRGVQHLRGQTGDDTYHYGTDSGRVFISIGGENARMGNDTLVFTDLEADDLSARVIDYANANGSVLELSWRDGADRGFVRIADLGAHIEQYEFADGTVVESDFFLA